MEKRAGGTNHEALKHKTRAEAASWAAEVKVGINFSYSKDLNIVAFAEWSDFFTIGTLLNAVTCSDHTKVKIKQIFVLCLPSLHFEMDPEGPTGRPLPIPGYWQLYF